jgi:hypothetical protein
VIPDGVNVHWSPDGSRISYQPADPRSFALGTLEIAAVDGTHAKEFGYAGSGPWNPFPMSVPRDQGATTFESATPGRDRDHDRDHAPGPCRPVCLHDRSVGDCRPRRACASSKEEDHRLTAGLRGKRAVRRGCGPKQTRPKRHPRPNGAVTDELIRNFDSVFTCRITGLWNHGVVSGGLVPRCRGSDASAPPKSSPT